jgi:hypothetical protein
MSQGDNYTMENHFSWLHLTDLHFGQPNQGPLWPNVREAFFNDLEHLHRKCGPWHAVIFTGDLVFSGQKDQFTTVEKEVLPRIWEKLAELGSPNAKLFAVPGNHDLARPTPSAVVRELVKQERFAEIADAFWKDSNSEHRQTINTAFSEYEAWWTNTQFRQKTITKGLISGDFVASLVLAGGQQVGIMGLNSTYLQLTGDNSKGQLHIDIRQTTPMCPDIPDWIKQHDACLLLTHQGIDWLSPSGQKQLQEINPAGRFAAHIYGHMHENKHTSTSTNGGPALRHWQSSSLFGMEKFGEPPTTMRAHGYTAGRIEFNEKAVSIRYWPRTATNDVNGWRIHADNSSVLEGDEGTHAEHIPLATVKRQPAPSTTTNTSSSHISVAQVPDTPETRGIFGRRVLIEKLAALLTQKSIVIVHGMRGNGKTTVIEETARTGPLHNSQALRLSANSQLNPRQLYQQLAYLLADTSENPKTPTGNADEIASALRNKTPNPRPFWLWIEHAHRLTIQGRFCDPTLGVFLTALGRAWPGQVRIILEFREQVPKGILGADAIDLEIPGLSRDELKTWLENTNPAWSMRSDELKRLFGWLGGGHGHLAHPHAIQLLIEVATGHNEKPIQTLERHLHDYERKIADVLLDDLYENVLTTTEKSLIDALSLYRDAIPHDHADYLERLLDAQNSWDSLCRRRLLAADFEGSKYYLHGFIADMLRQRLGYPAGTIDDDCLSEHPDNARPLHKHIASCWLATLGHSRRVSTLNINRGLNVLYHLCAAGDTDRLDNLAVELLGNDRNWVIEQLDSLQKRCRESKTYKDQRAVLEYWSKVAPDDPKVWRFLGSAWRNSEGWQSKKAREAFRNACVLLPEHPEHWSNYGRASLAASREEVRIFIDDIQRLCPEEARDGHVDAIIADSMEKLGQHEDAMALRQAKIDAGSNGRVRNFV